MSGIEVATGQLVNNDLNGADPLRSECSDLLYAIKEARAKMLKPTKKPCTCSGFVLQYEGSCQCGSGYDKVAAENEFWQLVDSI